jgi:hypothetical protein
MRAVWSLLSFVLLIAPSMLVARTSVTVTPTVGVVDLFPQETLDGIADDFEKLVDANGPYLAEANMLSNLAAYPIGDPNIGTLPHMQGGIGLAGGFANMKYFDGKAEENSLPAVGMVPVYHFGTGLLPRLDCIVRLSYFDIAFFDPDTLSSVSDFITIRDFKIVGMGGRLRYQLVGSIPVVPFLLSLKGVNISAGADVLRGIISLNRELDDTLGTYEVDPAGPVGPTAVALYQRGEMDASIAWTQLNIATQVTAYTEVLQFLTVYAGLGMAVGYSWYTISVDADTEILSDDPLFPGAPGVALGTATFDSKNTYNPYPLIPTVVIGGEVSLFLVRFSAETMVNLRNKEDVTLSLGMRFQF